MGSSRRWFECPLPETYPLFSVLLRHPAGMGAGEVEACGHRLALLCSERTEMRKLRLLVLSVLLAVPVVGSVATPAHACTSTVEPDGCEVVNRVCEKAFKVRCLG